MPHDLNAVEETMKPEEVMQDARIPLSSEPDRTEARKFPRFDVELPCLFSAEQGPDWSGTAVNFSRGGCAIRSSAPVQRGDYLRILIFASHDCPIEVGLAPVRWAAGDRFGVEFILIAPHDVSRLEELLTLEENHTVRPREKFA